MPIYEYECKNCGHRLEAIQGFNDAPLMDCPACNKAELAKLLSAPAFHLKGNGWYATDFKNPPANAASPQEKQSETSAASTSDTGVGESKTTVTAETTNKTNSST